MVKPPRKFRRPQDGRQRQGDKNGEDSPQMHPHEGEFITVRRDRVNLVTDEHHSEPLTDDNVTTFRVTKWGPESTDGKDLAAGNLRLQTKDGEVIPSSIASRLRPAFRPNAANAAAPAPRTEDLGGFGGGQPGGRWQEGGRPRAQAEERPEPGGPCP